MAKKIKEVEVDESEVNTEDSQRQAIFKLLELKAPGIFEREPAPGFVGKNVDALVDDIINLFV